MSTPQRISILKGLVLNIIEPHINNIEFYGKDICNHFQRKFKVIPKENNLEEKNPKEIDQYFTDIVSLYGEICTVRELINAEIDPNYIEIIEEGDSTTPDIMVNNPGRNNSYIEVCTSVWQDFDDSNFDDEKLLCKIVQKKSFKQFKHVNKESPQLIFYPLIGRFHLKYWADTNNIVQYIDNNPLDLIQDKTQIVLSFTPETNQHVIIFSHAIVEGIGKNIIWINDGMGFKEISIIKLKEIIQNSEVYEELYDEIND